MCSRILDFLYMMNVPEYSISCLAACLELFLICMYERTPALLLTRLHRGHGTARPVQRRGDKTAWDVSWLPWKQKRKELWGKRGEEEVVDAFEYFGRWMIMKGNGICAEL